MPLLREALSLTVDQVLGLGKAQLHHGNEAVAAGQHERLIAQIGQQSHGLLKARGPMVVEGSRNHGGCLPLVLFLSTMESRAR